MRDRIIQEQKIIIQKNNIVNRITYGKLNSRNENSQNLFEKIGQRRASQPAN